MNRTERALKIDLLKRELDRLESRHPSCRTCKNFDSVGRCELAPDQYVPEEIVKDGCDEWFDDGIPF